MVASLALTALLACTSDPLYTPTPTLGWSAVVTTPHVDSYKVYWRVPPNILWTLGAVVPCRHEMDEVTGEEIHETQVCQGEVEAFDDGSGFAYPVQRMGDWELTTVEFTVTAYSSNGESLVLSTPVAICMPEIYP
jgi:hypothetical protein